MKKKILLIGTGGTIASDITSSGLKPNFDAKELISFVPELENICDIECRQLFSIDSTNITPSHWCDIVREVQKSYGFYDGFVITHGTDTMAYTAAALSYLIQNTAKPIVLTGSQRPIGYDGSDAKTNLRDSFICACSDKLCGVTVLFDGRVICGTRAKKTHSKSLSAFESINFPYIASVTGKRVIPYIEFRQTQKRCFFDNINADVGVIKMFPSMKSSQLEKMLDGLNGAVIESYGAGGLPLYGMDDVLERAFARGVVMAMTTQAENGGSDLSAYAVGRRLKKHPRLLEGYDITTEAAFAKLLWILSQSTDIETVRKMFYTPVQFDIYPPDCLL